MPKKTSYVGFRHPDAGFITNVLTELSAYKTEGLILEQGFCRVDRPRYSWDWETPEQLIADLSDNQDYRGLNVELSIVREENYLRDRSYVVVIECGPKSTKISTRAPSRSEVDKLHAKLLSHLENAIVTTREEEVPNIFIAHGGNDQWKDLKNHLSDQQGFKVTAFETGDRAGHHIRDILEGELDTNNFAFLIMTAEDEQVDGTFRARQNVVHEAGLFQGRLGFAKAVILREEGVEMFSNVAGINFISFDKGNIRSAFGDAVAAVRATFGMK